MTDTSNSSAHTSLGVGTILSESFSLTMRNFLWMFLLMLLPIIATMALGAALFGSAVMEMMVNPQAFEQMMLTDPTGFWLRYGAWIIVAMLAFSFFYAGAIKLIFDAKLGGRGSIGSAFSAGLSGMVRLFIMTFFFFLLFMIVYLVGAMIIGGAIGVIGSPVVGIILGIVALIGLAYFMAMFLPFASIVVVESSWFAAFGRALRLTGGYRWSIVGLGLLFILAMIVVMLLIGVVMYGVLLAGTVGAILAGILYVVAMIVIYGAMVAMITLVYARLREIKEGTSIESLSEIFA